MKIFCNEKITEHMKIDRKWKENNKRYIEELQKFFDRVDEIKDEELKKCVINQMLTCDNILTEIAEDKFTNFYKEGYKKAKQG